MRFFRLTWVVPARIIPFAVAALLLVLGAVAVLLLARPPAWTLAFYPAGGPGLEADQRRNLAEIRAGAARIRGARLVLFLDPALGAMPQGDAAARREPEVVRVEGAGAYVPETLRRFLELAWRRFPAGRRALFLAGHGAGWWSEAEGAPGFTAPGIREALRGSPVDLLVLDACALGDLESVWELRHTARILVVHQATVPPMGLDYRRLLEGMSRARSLSPEAAAHLVIDAYRRDYAGRMYPISVSALRLDGGFAAFVAAFQEAAAQPAGAPGWEEACRAAVRPGGWSEGRERRVDLVRLVDSLDRPDLSARVRSFRLAHFAANTPLQGLSIYLPRSTELLQRDRERYDSLSLSIDFPQGWSRRLPALAGGGAAAVRLPTASPPVSAPPAAR